MTKLRSGWMFGLTCILLFSTELTIPLHAQTFTTLVDFVGPNGMEPFYPLVQGPDGNLYGTAFQGGANCSPGCGTVFKVSPSGTLTTLYSFCSQANCTDGSAPESGLAFANDGKFYGTTAIGGANNSGTFFKITPQGNLATLYSFCGQANCYDGANPVTTPTQGVDGNFYGATQAGGNGYGTLFKLTPDGKLTTLYRFCSLSNCADGNDVVAQLTQASDGNFYGTTNLGGTANSGTIYRITPSGTFTSLYSFCAQSGCPDGAYPGDGALVQAGNGGLYGTTSQGGEWRNGTAYKISLAGMLTTLASFCRVLPDCVSGAGPLFGLVKGTDGSFYGTSTAGGSNGERGGVTFKMTPPSKLTVLHAFCSLPSCADGEFPGGLVQATDGNVYGVTNVGGTGGYGTVYSLALGLAPFVETIPAAARAGNRVLVLGNNLTGSIAVSFNGAPATFSVVSDTEITTTVPTGATSGLVTVSTASGTLTSNKPFRVIP